jgi:hypothetical protein
MNREIDQPAFGAPPPRRTRASRALYWVIAIAIALVSIRLCLWFLARAGLIAEDDANLMLVVAVPIALLTIGKMAPSRADRR